MLSDSELDELLAFAGESDRIDLKGHMAWKGDQRASLAKDVVAFANTRNGGIIVLGREENKKLRTFNDIGLSDDAYSSFDTTDCLNWINQRFSPDVEMICYHREKDGKKYVIIEVEEFSEEPIICVRNLQEQGGAKYLLKEGEIYVRGKNANSKKLDSADEMRRLTGLAIRKKGDELLASIDAIIAGRKAETPDEQQTDMSIQDAQELLERLEKTVPISNDSPGWACAVFPITYDAERFPLEDLRGLIQRQDIGNYRGRLLGQIIESDSIQNGIVCNRYSDSGLNYGLTQSGVFGIHMTFRDQEDCFQYDKHLLFIMKLCQFVSSFAHEFPPATKLRMQFTAEGIGGRVLTYPNVPVYPDEKPAIESQFVFECDVSVEELIADWKSVASDVAFRLFRLFPTFFMNRAEVENEIRTRRFF